MHIFTIKLRPDNPIILVSNLSGKIECRLSKKALDTPDKLLKRICSKLGGPGRHNRDFSIQITDIREYLDNGDIVIYIIRNIARGVLVDKIRSQFGCCISNKNCEVDHYDDFEQMENTEFLEFENDIDLFMYLVRIRYQFIGFASNNLTLDKSLILNMAKTYNDDIIELIPHDIISILRQEGYNSDISLDDPKCEGHEIVSKFNNFWNDEDIIQICLKSKYKRCYHLSSQTRTKYANYYVNIKPKNIEYIPYDTPDYDNLCIYAISKNVRLYRCISHEMQNNPEIIKLVLLSCDDYIISMVDKKLIQQLGYDVIKSCIIQNNISNTYSYALYDLLPYSLRCDRTLLELSIGNCKLESIPRKLKQNYDIIKMYLDNNIHKHKFPNYLSRKFSIYKLLCSQEKYPGIVFQSLSYKQRRNRNFVLETVKNRLMLYNQDLNDQDTKTYYHIRPIIKYMDDEEIVKYALKTDNKLYQYISVRLQKIKSFALLGLSDQYDGYRMYPFIPLCLKSDPDIIIKTLNNSPYSDIPEYILNLRKSILNRFDIMTKLDLTHSENKRMLDSVFRNYEARKKLFSIDGSLIRYYKVGSDIELMTIAVRQDPSNIKYIPEKYKHMIATLI
jgi:hypothetical protein